MTALLTLVFFLSGAAGLMFETLWFRAAGLSFGNSVWASSLVLGSFMAGLALGNGLAARWGSRIRRPGVAYAWLEGVVAVAGIGLVWLLPALPEFLAPVFRPFLGEPWLLNPIRFGLGFALLCVPTTAMGMTLPLMVKALRDRGTDFSSALGVLYGVNTLGAMAGALAGEWLLLPRLGVLGTSIFAGSLNVTAALGALAAAHLVGRAGEEPPRPIAARPIFPLPMDLLRLLIAAMIAGGLLLALEVVWFRFLQLFVLSTTRGFAIMLLVVLLGIGGGGLLSTVWLRLRPNAFRYVSHLAMLCGLFALWSYIRFEGVPAELDGAKSVDFADTLLLCVRLMLPVSIASGVLFTFIGRAVYELYGEATGAVGWLTLFNTAGAAVGALLAGWLFVPVLGVEISIFVLALGYVVVAFVSPFSLLASQRAAFQGLLVLAFGWLGTAFLFPFGMMMNHFVPLSTEQYRTADTEIVEVREGLTEHIVFLEDTWMGEPFSARLVTNAFSMTGTTIQAQRYMKYFAYWPMAFHPKLERALLISYGLGITARALTESPDIERIDVVDISEDIVAMSDRVYRDPADRPLLDERVNVFIEDGRFYLLTTEEKYDLITGEPPPLMVAGVVNLYTEEYFDLVRSRLRDGGYVTYWLPVVHLSPADTRAVVRAFCNAFEDCSLWRGARLELVLIGSNGASEKIAPERFERPWNHPETRAGLSTIGLERPELLLATFLGDASYLDAFAGDTLPLVDDHPYRLSRDIAGRDAFQERVGFYVDMVRDDEVAARYNDSEYLRARLPATLYESGSQALPYHSLLERSLNVQAQAGLYFEELDHLLSETDLETVPLWVMGDLRAFSGVVDALVAKGQVNGTVAYHLGLRAMSRREFGEAAEHFADALRKGIPDRRVDYYLILALGYDGALERAFQAAEALAEKDPASLEQTAFWEFCARRFNMQRPSS